MSKPTDYENSPAGGSRNHSAIHTGHSSQYRLNGPLGTMPWMFGDHSDTGLCGCRRRILSHCMVLSQYTMMCSIIEMLICDHY